MDKYELTPERKAKIDALSPYEVCHVWRFGVTGNWMVMGECGAYLGKKSLVYLKQGSYSKEVLKYVAEKAGYKNRNDWKYLQKGNEK